MNFSVRKASFPDAHKIAQMESAYIDCPWSEEQVRAEIENADALFFVAEKADEVIGYISGVIAADECEVSNIAVEKAYRRQKVGSGLFAELIDKSAQRGVKRLFLLVNSDNIAAISLYEKIGFGRVGLRRGYYTSGDAIVMRLEL